MERAIFTAADQSRKLVPVSRSFAPVSECIAEKRRRELRLESCYEAAAMCRRPGVQLLERLRRASADYAAEYGELALSAKLWNLRDEGPASLAGAALGWVAIEDLDLVLKDLESRCRTGRDRSFYCALRDFLARDTTDGEYDLDWDIEDVVGELREAVEEMPCPRPETVRLVWSKGTQPLDCDLRAQVITALPLEEVPELVAVLQEEAFHPSAAVRRAVAARLTDVASEEAVVVATSMMRDGDMLVRRDADKLLGGRDQHDPIFPSAVAGEGYWLVPEAGIAACERPLFVATASHQGTYSFAVLRYTSDGTRLANAWGNAGVARSVYSAFKTEWQATNGFKRVDVAAPGDGAGKPKLAPTKLSVARGRVWADMASSLFPTA